MAYWILQGNPKIYDTHGALQAGTIDRWRIARYIHEISRGDEFALWISGPNGGVRALGIVTGPPHRETDPDPFWVDPADGREIKARGDLRTIRKLSSAIPRADLQPAPGCARSL